MTTQTETRQTQNVSNNERSFRVLLAMGIMTAILAGVIPAPLAMFAGTLIAVYLVVTSIISVDPVYRLIETLGHSTTHTHSGTKQAHA